LSRPDLGKLDQRGGADQRVSGDVLDQRECG
jgi:hypothetical protein